MTDPPGSVVDDGTSSDSEPTTLCPAASLVRRRSRVAQERPRSTVFETLGEGRDGRTIAPRTLSQNATARASCKHQLCTRRQFRITRVLTSRPKANCVPRTRHVAAPCAPCRRTRTPSCSLVTARSETSLRGDGPEGGSTHAEVRRIATRRAAIRSADVSPGVGLRARRSFGGAVRPVRARTFP